VFAFEVQVCEQTLVGRRVEDLLELGEALLVVIRRGSSTIIPHGETRLEAGDSIVLVGTAADEARVREVFSARHEARTA